MEIITAKIDVTKIDKARLFKGKSGTYLDFVLVPNKKSNFGDDRDNNTHMIVQSITKEERLAGKRGNILGNARTLAPRNDEAAKPVNPKPNTPPQDDDDEMPF